MEKKSGHLTVRLTPTPGSKTKQSAIVVAVPFPKCDHSAVAVLHDPVSNTAIADPELAALAYALAMQVRSRIAATPIDAANNKISSFDWYVSSGHLHLTVTCDKVASNVRVVLGKMMLGLVLRSTRQLWSAAMRMLGKSAAADSWSWAASQASDLTKDVKVSIASPMKCTADQLNDIVSKVSKKIPSQDKISGGKKPEKTDEAKVSSIAAPGFLGYFLLNFLQGVDRTPLHLSDGKIMAMREGWKPPAGAKNRIDGYVAKLERVKVTVKGKKVDVLGPIALYLASINGGVAIGDLMAWSKSPKSASEVKAYLKKSL